MRTATVSQLRDCADEFFDAVEQGEAIEIYRRGRPVAVVSPLRPPARSRWQTAAPIKLEGDTTLSRAILDERTDRV